MQALKFARSVKYRGLYFYKLYLRNNLQSYFINLHIWRLKLCAPIFSMKWAIQKIPFRSTSRQRWSLFRRSASRGCGQVINFCLLQCLIQGSVSKHERGGLKNTITHTASRARKFSSKLVLIKSAKVKWTRRRSRVHEYLYSCCCFCHKNVCARRRAAGAKGPSLWINSLVQMTRVVMKYFDSAQRCWFSVQTARYRNFAYKFACLFHTHTLNERKMMHAVNLYCSFASQLKKYFLFGSKNCVCSNGISKKHTISIEKHFVLNLTDRKMLCCNLNAW